MQILLINPAFSYSGKDNFPLGLGYIAAVAQQSQCGVTVIDENLHEEIPWTELKRFDIIGFSITTPTFIHVQELLPRIHKEKKIDAILLAGGHHPTFRAEEVLHTGFDLVFRGESEQTFQIFLQTLNTSQSWVTLPGISFKDREGRIIHNPFPKLNPEFDQLPFPARYLFHYEKYSQMSIITSRGCPYQCSYCAAAAFWQHSIRYRSVPNIIQELKEITSLFPYKEIKFQDSVFTMHKDRTRALMQAMIDNQFEFQWMCETRADCLDCDLLRLMKHAHCKSIMLGFESGSPVLLAQNNRVLNIETFIAVSQQIKDAGIGLRVSIIFGLPGETKETIQQTIVVLKQIQPNVTFLNLATSYPGCAIEKAPTTSHNPIWLKKFGGHGMGGSVVLPEGMSPAEYRKLATYLQAEVDKLNRVHWGK